MNQVVGVSAGRTMHSNAANDPTDELTSEIAAKNST